MPYIKLEDKQKFNEVFAHLPESMTPGELNYAISILCLHYINIKGENYTHLNDVIGVLENAKIELYRRKIAKYEEKKIRDNGDIY